MLGISTCWWHGGGHHGEDIVRDVLEMGLDKIELEYRISERTFRQMRPFLNKDLKVLSIHNYFPKPDDLEKGITGSGDLFLLSSTDKDERAKAVNFTIRTMNSAEELGTKAVILHLGRVDMENPKTKLMEFDEKGVLTESEGAAYLDKQKELRQATYRKHLDAVLFSLEELNEEARKRSIWLCIENRYHLREIPNFDEIGIILRAFEGGNIRYWHDVGHAHAQETMGLVKQKDLLRTYSGQMMGVHLHDAKGIDDHRAPGEGQLEFEALMPFLKASGINILEVHPKSGKEALIKGIKKAKALGFK